MSNVVVVKFQYFNKTSMISSYTLDNVHKTSNDNPRFLPVNTFFHIYYLHLFSDGLHHRILSILLKKFFLSIYYFKKTYFKQNYFID